MPRKRKIVKEPIGQVKRKLTKIFTTVLGLKDSQIEEESTFDEDFGMSDEEKVKIRQRVSRDFGVLIPEKLWAEYNVVKDLYDHFRQVGKL